MLRTFLKGTSWGLSELVWKHSRRQILPLALIEKLAAIAIVPFAFWFGVGVLLLVALVGVKLFAEQQMAVFWGDYSGGKGRK
ncbi:MAG: hypothetical protein A3F35_00065 [Candidatus Woykebacteria bacterium RIFCSPHIGHO2_12_FULL_45_10]|uniref:Uncharacterized protein n=1 Tax=Candidatus Woykebacteria bacterium RIFCSPHIGHO2_12_FULL_45_10 TaxID=1802603 RepID=A0A1G1WR13_9BACT|nr:MAG: hypothetical protein A3F35_00065 [Candidatus Woykebacteria bacterium RIFCSPHIGHO2_12_FULL_45_10]